MIDNIYRDYVMHANLAATTLDRTIALDPGYLGLSGEDTAKIHLMSNEVAMSMRGITRCLYIYTRLLVIATNEQTRPRGS